MKKKTAFINKILFFLAAPIMTAAILLYAFYSEGLYPFGDGSVTWCDMSQQALPLLLDFKDILDGKGSLFLNMNNAGGMNFYGVFFFFLSNPFSFLIKFIPKSDAVLFVNILVILKLCLASATAYIYFKKAKQRLSSAQCFILSAMYSLCGYGMLFYQNIMWLDVMYLFPLLVLSLERIFKRQCNIPYIILLSLVIIFNYYIGIMVAVYVLLYAGINILREKDATVRQKISLKIISGTVISGLLTAVVWLPSYLQVSASGRGESVKETLNDSGFLSSYETVLPLLFCTAFIFSILALNIFSGKERTKKADNNLILFALTLVPFFIEPINLMWHTGNYMSFPARFGFITVFAGLVCSADALESDCEKIAIKKGICNIPAFIIAACLCIIYFSWISVYADNNIFTLSVYTDTLWGNAFSFDALAKMFFISSLIYGIIYLLYKKRAIAKSCFVILLAVILTAEAVTNTRVYMTSYYLRNDSRTDTFKSITEMADKIDDDEFYRVITDEKITDYNMIGALGYPTLAHYTSLTDKDFMFTQKRLGYTSVWMEVSSHGGTELTNALYSAKYKLVRGNYTDTVYSGNDYSIIKEPYYLGAGLITDKAISEFEKIPSSLTRAEIQQYIYSSLYDGKKLINEYRYNGNSTGISFTGGKYHISAGGEINYRISIEGKQSLYADCFNTLSNDLSEIYFDSLQITVDGMRIADKYPTTTMNGLLKLGEFENQTVDITINALKNISCYSFGVFGLDTNVLSDAIASSKTAGLKYNNGQITGSYTAKKDESLILFTPYNEGFSLKINGEKTEYSRVLSDFIGFKLNEGENLIEISFTPKGFNTGLILSISGALLFVFYIIFRKKLPSGKIIGEIAAASALTVAAIGVAIIYIYPIAQFIIKEFKA